MENQINKINANLMLIYYQKIKSFFYSWWLKMFSHFEKKSVFGVKALIKKKKNFGEGVRISNNLREFIMKIDPHILKSNAIQTWAIRRYRDCDPAKWDPAIIWRPEGSRTSLRIRKVVNPSKNDPKSRQIKELIELILGENFSCKCSCVCGCIY